MLSFPSLPIPPPHLNTPHPQIRVPDCDAGWEAGQHVQLRVFFRNRFMEAHPLSIVTAPPSTSCISNEGIVLAVRACGDWSKALNEYANSDAQQSHVSALTLKAESELATGFPEVPIRVMLDGPYGGCSINLGRYENVLFLAGGSGATFTISLLDDLVARCAKLRRPGDEKTNRIEFVWCIRSFGTFASHIMFYLTSTSSFFRCHGMVCAAASDHSRYCNEVNSRPPYIHFCNLITRSSPGCDAAEHRRARWSAIYLSSTQKLCLDASRTEQSAD